MLYRQKNKCKKVDSFKEKEKNYENNTNYHEHQVEHASSLIAFMNLSNLAIYLVDLKNGDEFVNKSSI